MSLAVALFVASTVATGAPTAREQAAEWTKRGAGHFKDGALEQALESFERAYRISGEPSLLLNIAQCHRALGRTALTIEYFERFIAAALDHPLRPGAEQPLAQLKRAQPAAPPDSKSEAFAFKEPQATATPGPGAARWPWIVGAVVIVGAAATVSYFALRPQPPPTLARIELPAP